MKECENCKKMKAKLDLYEAVICQIGVIVTKQVVKMLDGDDVKHAIEVLKEEGEAVHEKD